MKIVFSTIAIEKLVISYAGIFGSLLALNYMFDLDVHPVFFLLLPVALYFLFKGKVEISISGNKLDIIWQHKPLLGTAYNRGVEFTEIIRWKYEHSFRGPDKLTLILESGEKISIRPDLFTMKDVETELTKALEEKISEANSGIPREVLHQKIKNSGYIQKLEKKNRIVKLLMYIFLAIGIISVMAGAFFPNSQPVWILFFISFCCSISFILWHLYLKSERKKTLQMD